MPILTDSLPDLIDRALEGGRFAEADALILRLLGDGDRHFDGIVACSRAALARGDLDSAVRWAERACRYNPGDIGVRAFCAALFLRAGRPGPVPELLKKALDSTMPTAGIVLGQALLRLGRAEELRALLDKLLRRFPPSAAPMLAELANESVDSGLIPGWAAADTGGVITGALASSLAGNAAVDVAVAGTVIVRSGAGAFRERFANPGVPGGFAVPLSGARRESPLAVTLDGQALPGMPSRVCFHPPVEGMVEFDGERLVGWAWCPADPSLRPGVQVSDGGGRVFDVVPDQLVEGAASLGIENGPYGFSLNPDTFGVRPGLLHVTAGEDRVPLLGSPLQYGGERRRTPVTPLPPRSGRTAPAACAVDIIVPVYGARSETLACLAALLESLRRNEAPPHEVVVIDDAGPDPELIRDLEVLAASGRITLLRNERNLGFPGTVNRGLSLHPDRDVVLLNADTLPVGDWLVRLRAAAYDSPATMSATPLSNDATILSYPTVATGKSQPPVPDLAGTATLDTLARLTNPGERLEIPTAVGFCVYLRRDAMTETGLFDALSFGRGYGEENDYCLRARRLGWRHVAALDVFVAHVGGRSFGRAKTLLSARNERVLERLHPGYDNLIRNFIHTDPLMAARRRLDLARWTDRSDRPAVLIVTLGLGGGVARFVNERIRSAATQGQRVLTLSPDPFPDAKIRQAERLKNKPPGSDRAGRRPDPDDDGPTGRCRLTVSDRPDLNDLVFRTEEEFAELLAVLRSARVATVEIHHVLGHAPIIITIPEELSVPYDCFVHDFSLACPRVTLVDATGQYCREPSLDVCERCVADPADRFDPSLSTAALRRRSRTLLAGARRVIAATGGTAARLRRMLEMPDLGVDISPWEEGIPVPPRPSPGTGRHRVVVVGAVGRQKGYDVLLACARDAVARDLPLEFVLVGFSDDDARLVETGRVFVVGRFDENEAVDLVRAQNAGVAFLPSITPETWCYALSTVWRAGLMAVAFDLGAIGERIRAQGGGLLLPPGDEPAAINEKLLRFLDDSKMPGVASCTKSGPSAREEFVKNIQAGRQAGNRLSIIGEAQSMNGPNSSAENRLPNAVEATTQVFVLPPGFYSVCVLKGGAEPVAGQIPLPGIQLSAVPMPAAGSGVEFLSSLPGNWLTKAGDTVVVRVYGAQPSSIVLTSFKHRERPDDSLNLQIARIDDVSAASAAAAAPVAQAIPPARVELLLHIGRTGDQRYPDSAWAGILGKRQWVEAFSISPVEHITADEIEYKGLTANGWETAWLSGGALCGSRGLGTPLIGFSVRLKGAAADRFDCVYEGAFVSGQRTAPMANGAPCRSDVIGDPLEGILLRIVPKAAPAPRIV